MDIKSKALLGLMFTAVLLSAMATYYRTMVVRDFPVTITEDAAGEI